MIFQRGEVVLAWYPFASATGGKLRPCVIVQNDLDNRRLKNVMVALVTSNLRARNQPSQCFIAVNTPEGQQAGILTDSLISCNNIMTIDQTLIARVIGRLTPVLMAQVDDCLKIALELP